MRTFPAVLIALSLCACTVDRAAVQQAAPDLVSDFDALTKAELDAKAALQKAQDEIVAARATPDEADDELAAANAERSARVLADVEDRFAAFEQKVIAREAQPFSALPYGLGALVTAAVPMLGSRGRRQYANALRSLSRGQLLNMGGDLLKALGAQHSVPPAPPADDAGLQAGP